MAWSPDLIQLFEDMKKCITSYTILARFHPIKPVFLKTDWSAEGITWILMHPDDDKESKKEEKKLVATSELYCDLEKNGARLRPVSYVLCSCWSLGYQSKSTLPIGGTVLLDV